MARSRPELAALLAAVMVAAPPALAILSLASAAQAQSSAKVTVDAAKASGVVGEQSDGTLGIVSDGDAAIRAAVAEINAGRAAAYRDAAAKTGVTPAAAGEAAYRQLLSRMPSGYFYRAAGADWARK